jgi:hypothetical protein
MLSLLGSTLFLPLAVVYLPAVVVLGLSVVVRYAPPRSERRSAPRITTNIGGDR